ncbi:MAG: FtsX-like permease family protein, partial [Dehalococcoidales bacterium]
MSHLLSEWQLIIKRSLANWRLLSTVMVGVLIAVALLSSTPLYSNAINDLGLKRSLQQQQIELLDLHVFSTYDFIIYQDFQDSTDFINRQVSRNIRTIIRQDESWIKTQSYLSAWADRPVPAGGMRPTGHFQVFSNLEEHVTLVEGQFARPVPGNLSRQELEDPEFAIEGMIGSETAELFGVSVGDRLIFRTGFGADERQINIDLTAIIDPIDLSEEFWFLKTDVFTMPDQDGIIAPIFIPEETLFNGVAGVIPASRAQYNWLYFVDIEKIGSENAGNIRNAVNRMERQILANLPKTGLLTNIQGIIGQYQEKLLFTQIPLFLIVSQIVAVILYYLITVSNMLIERQAGEIALFRSRGASTRQIVGIYLAEGLIITAIGAAVGPFLGASVFSLMGTTASFSHLTGGGLLPIRFSGMVFLLAAAAAILCLLALVVPAIQAARRGMVHQRQKAARPTEAPFLQRFYLDLVILGFGAVLYWELQERGSLLTIGVFGGMNMDPLLLITPMLLMLAVAIIFLRFFPVFIGLATRLGGYIKSTPVVLGLWYIARNPIHYGRLILLLIMAGSVGMFSATFLGTLERSYDERVLFSAGSDVRLEKFREWGTTKKALQEQYSGLPGVVDSSFANRIDGRVGTMFTETTLNLLAVDASNFSRISWYREDFSDKPLAELMDLLAADEPIEQGLKLPEGAETLGIQVYPEMGNPEIRVIATIKDDNGRYREYDLGTTDIDTDGWQYLEVNFSQAITGLTLAPPLTITSIFVTYMEQSRFFGNPGGVYFDDLKAGGPSFAEPVVIEDFETLGKWAIAADSSSGSFSQTQSGSDRFEINNETVFSGNAAAHISWNHRRGPVEKGIFANVDSRPLAAIVSTTFLDRAKLELGDELLVRIPGQFIPVVIKEVIDYFPTLDPEKKGFVIVNIDRLASPRNLLGVKPINPNEGWLRLTDDPELRAETIDILETHKYGAYKLYDTDAMIMELEADPLAGAGWGGVLMIA